MDTTSRVTKSKSKTNGFFLALRWFGLACLLAAGSLAFQQWQRFNQLQAIPVTLPAGSVVAGIPVGGLSPEAARKRLTEAYDLPVEARLGAARLNISPEQAGFQLDLDKMLATRPAQAPDRHWQAFQDYLWGRVTPAAPLEASLAWSYDPAKLRQFLLDEVAPRYNQLAVAPVPAPGTIDFLPGRAGQELDVDAAVQLIAAALPARANRTVELPMRSVAPPVPAWANLEVLLRQTLRLAGLDALAAVYVRDLKTGREIHFATQNGQEIPVKPADVVFTASSIIKIPILVSVFRHLPGDPDAGVDDLLTKMIRDSSNEAADAVMKTALDEVRGPLMVTEDIQKLGLENTFLAGYFALGSPLLNQYRTPANLRVDINTQPDPYSQTTPADIGTLLGMIYQCASQGSGKLPETFPGEINQPKCQRIVEYLKLDRQPYLIMNGLPEGTPLAHKHGYGSQHDVITTIGDAGLVFSTGGDYVLVLFFNNPNLLLFDPANALVSNLSAATYHYFNPPPPKP